MILHCLGHLQPQSTSLRNLLLFSIELYMRWLPSTGISAMARKRKTPVPALAKDFDSDSLGSPDSSSSKSGSSKSEKPPLIRNAANARERSRMRVLSKAFSRLKTTLPWVPADTKLSKLDTLRLAACYIAHLREILAEDKIETTTSTRNTGPIHPLNLVGYTYIIRSSRCWLEITRIHVF